MDEIGSLMEWVGPGIFELLLGGRPHCCTHASVLSTLESVDFSTGPAELCQDYIYACSEGSEFD